MQPKAYAERQDLLGLALDIHMSHTGSFPDLSDGDLEHAVNLLRNRVGNWLYQGHRTAMFDTAVKMLLTVAVHEGELEQSRRAAWKATENEQ